MKPKQLSAWLLTLVTALASSGCGESIILAEGGIGGTGISSGQVSGFGSVFVNGVRFDTREAQIFVDGVEAGEEALQVGMTVTVYGTIDADDPSRGSARKIEFAYLLRAAVESIDRSRGTIVAAGQTIQTDELTVFAGTTLEALVPGDEIAVSGVLDAGNNIVASYIRLTPTQQPIAAPEVPADGIEVVASKYPAASDAEISGIISELDPLSQTFVIGNQTVSYAGTGAGTLSEGSLVHLSGSLSEGALQATTIEPLESRYQGEEGDTLTFAGFVSRILGRDSFEVAATPVHIDSGTLFSDGSRSELAKGSRVRIRATFNRSGALIAERITFLRPATIHISAAVDSVGSRALTLATIALTTSNATLMLDSSDNIRAFSLADIGVGDRLSVYGRQSADGILLSRLERKPETGNTVIQAPLEQAVDEQTFDLLGIRIDTSIIPPENGFFDTSGNPISHTAFYTALEEGEIVYARGTLSGSTLIATEAGIK